MIRIDRSPDTPPSDPFTILEDQLYAKMQSLSAFQGLKKENMWKLLFMERRFMDNGKFAMETEEPGYLQAMMKGYLFMLNTLGQPLTPEFYEQMHDQVVDGLKTKEYQNGVPKGYRKYEDGGEAFGLHCPETASEKGLNELYARWKSYCFSDETNDECKFLQAVMKSPPIFTEGTTRYLLQLKPIRPETCKKIIQFYQKTYQIAPKNDENEKLRAIVRICQDKEDTHVFIDGNVRNAGILLINKLLLEQGLSPTALYDVNCLDGLSEDELIERIKEGQAFVRSLMS